MSDKVAVEVIDDAAAEEASAVVCVRDVGQNLYFADDVRTTCSKCGHPIIHRPSAPVKPAKVCMECAITMMAAEEERGEPVGVATSAKSIEELRQWVAAEQPRDTSRDH
jgi:hypothetical protein